MTTPRIPPRPVSYVSSADTMDQENENEMGITDDDEVKRPEKPPPANKPTLPVKDCAPPKPLRKAQTASTQQSASAPVKPQRPRSTHEPDRSIPPRPMRPPTVKSAAPKPPVAKAQSKPAANEQTSNRPQITVISAKPMDSSGSIPLPDISGVKDDEKPSKPTKPSRQPLIKRDSDKVHTEKDAELTKSSSLERPVAKKRTSHDAIPEQTGPGDKPVRRPPSIKGRPAVKSRSKSEQHEEQGDSHEEQNPDNLAPVPRKRTKSDAKVPPPKPALPQDRRKPPLRPAYSVDAAKLKHSSEKSSQEDKGRDDQQSQKPPEVAKRSSLPRPPVSEENVPAVDAAEDNTSNVEDKEQIKPTKRSRAQSGTKPPPKPKLPASRPAPPKMHKPSVPTTDKQEDELSQGAPQSTSQPHEDTSAIQEKSSDVKPEHVSRAQSGTKPPPKPKLPASRPAPPKMRKPSAPTTDKQEDESTQESSPSQSTRQHSEDTTSTVKDETSDAKPEDKVHVSKHKPPPKPSLPKPPPPKPAKPALPKPALPKPPKSTAIDDKQPKESEIQPDEPVNVVKDDETRAQETSDSQSEPSKGTDKAENEAVPAVSRRTSSKKWKPPVARSTVPKRDIKPTEKPEEKVTAMTTEGDDDDDQPPPRPLPPQDYQVEDTMKSEEKIPAEQSDKKVLQDKKPSPTLEKKPSPTLNKKPSPALEKKPLLVQETKTSPVIEKRPSPALEKKPPPTVEKRPSPPVEKRPSPPVEKRPSPPQEKKLPPSQLKESLPQTEKIENVQPEENESVSSKQGADNVPKKSTKKLPPPKPAAPSKRLSQNMEDNVHSKPSTEADKKPKPPRPTVPSAPQKRKTPEPRSASSPPPVAAPPCLPVRPVPGHPLYHYVSNEPRGTAKFDYQPDDEDELSFFSGDLIEFIERVDNDWIYARNTNDDCNEGLVLVKYLKVIKRLPGEDKLNYLKELPSAVAMFDFDGENEDELSFVAGDLIILEAKIDDMWLKGYVKSPAQSGMFPAKFVEVVEPLPEIDESATSNQGISAPLSKDLDQEVPISTSKKSTASTPSNEPYCVAESEFVAEGSDELSIQPGDRVILIERVNEDWLRGKLNDQIGIFPAAFVDIKVDIQSTPSANNSKNVTETSAQPDTKKDDGKPKGKCRATFAFDAEQEGELSLSVGDIIITSSWINDNWLFGECNGQEGMFPLEFVKVLQELPQDSTLVSDKIPKNISAESDLSPRVKAIQNYVASDSDELSFQVGDVIYLLEKVDKKFFEGELNNKVGKFPISHVEIIVPLP